MAKHFKESCAFRTSIGGQALMEGILMRGPKKQAIVCRTKDGLVEKTEILEPWRNLYPVLAVPFIRGIPVFLESLVKGMKALTYSATLLPEEEQGEPDKLEKWINAHFSESAAEKIHAQLRLTGRCIAVVNEGLPVGDIGARHDSFGHIEYGASAVSAAQALVNYLNAHHLPVRGQATGQIPGTIQRGVSMLASTVDIGEARELGREAVKIAMETGTGYMSTILRRPGDAYEPYYDKVELWKVANSERFLPKKWISADGTDVTDDFVRYAMPLIGTEDPPIPRERGLQRFARLTPVFVEKRCGAY